MNHTLLYPSVVNIMKMDPFRGRSRYLDVNQEVASPSLSEVVKGIKKIMVPTEYVQFKVYRPQYIEFISLLPAQQGHL